jgi:hypothetical protein
MMVSGVGCLSVNIEVGASTGETRSSHRRPGGTTVPLVAEREPGSDDIRGQVAAVLASWLQRNVVASVQIRKRIMASFRATATAAFLEPLRAARRTPQLLSDEKRLTRAERAACVKAAHAALEDGKSDEDAIFACIGAMKKGRQIRPGGRAGAHDQEAGRRAAGGLGLAALSPAVPRPAGAARHGRGDGAGTGAGGRAGGRAATADLIAQSIARRQLRSAR